MTHPHSDTQDAGKSLLDGTSDPARAIVDGRRTITAEQFDRLFPYRCPLCDQPLMFAIGVQAHLSVDHSWWERATFRAADTWSMLRAAFVDLFTTTMFMPRWAAIAAVAALSAAAAIGWWTR